MIYCQVILQGNYMEMEGQLAENGCMERGNGGVALPWVPWQGHAQMLKSVLF